MSIPIRRANAKELLGKEMFEIQPIILGGHPSDHANKTALTREQHIKAVTFWNREIRRLRVGASCATNGGT